ncbi:hypothetical protein GYMLUDRAFT_38542 [Collybiopsis luxurians FD-317 M1]|nr:hypothetical protein GYMLUDRAFT_38542 [Collybiopsis luxurians FD-317 M1]
MSELGSSPPVWNTSDSPFASLLGTNYSPTQTELGMLKALLIDPQLELSQLEAEIDRLCSRKQIVEKYVSAHKALASPIRQLPAEVLANIFVQCLPEYAVRDLNEAPLLLTRICRDWRIIALDTPRLWKTLHIYLPPNLSSVACSRRMEGVTAWLERSGSLSVSISFHGSTDLTRTLVHAHMNISSERTDLAQNNMESMIRTLLRFSSRFGQLFLSLSSSNFSTFSDLAPSNFPALTSLQLHVTDYHIGSHTPAQLQLEERMDFPPLLAGMPLLKALRVDQFFGKDYDYTSLPCNWENLTTVVIKDFLTPQQILAILVEAPQLQSVSLAISFADFEPISHPLVHLPHLSELRLSAGYGQANGAGLIWTASLADFRRIEEGVKFVLGCFQFSAALKLFSFASTHISVRDMIYIEWPFAGIPLHNLETLELAIPLESQALQGFSELLSQSHNLVTLRYNAVNLAGQLQDMHLLGLTPSSDNPDPWCPKLQKIQILNGYAHYLPYSSTAEYTEPFNACTGTAVTTFIQRRFDMSLKSCSMLFPKKLTFAEAELETLRSLQKQGHELQVSYAKSGYREERDLPDTGLRSGPFGGPASVPIHSPSIWEDPLEDWQGPYGAIVIV